MTVLTSSLRAKMPASAFAGGGPKGKKGFPMNDPTHARLAISGATRSMHAGNISASKAASIKAQARSRLRSMGGGKADGGVYHVSQRGTRMLQS